MMNITDTDPVAAEFEQLYIQLRQKEGRIYTDEEVAGLPNINKDHPNAKEWKTRERSLKKLFTYIKRKDDYLKILEVGCGNGWLSAQLAAVTKATVTGSDINKTELEQARRVFNQLPNLHYINGDLWDSSLNDKKFDLIIFAASIQYFSSLKEIITAALAHVTLQGEIHILDSHFYRQNEIEAAKQRTKKYYASKGFTALTNYYHHHTLEELNHFSYLILNDPGSWKNKISFIKNPFHWIVINNQ